MTDPSFVSVHGPSVLTVSGRQAGSFCSPVRLHGVLSGTFLGVIDLHFCLEADCEPAPP